MDQPLLDTSEEAGFTDRDRRAIAARLDAHPGWTVEFATAGGLHYAHLSASSLLPSPRLTLVRDEGLTSFAACWPDGRQFRAGLDPSLTHALGFLSHVLDARFDDADTPALHDRA